MGHLPERKFILSNSAATAGYDAEHFNGLVHQFDDVSPEIGRALFQHNAFDRVFRTQVVKRHEYQLVEKLMPVYLG